MVFHFHPRGYKAGSQDWLIYMYVIMIQARRGSTIMVPHACRGRDKYENEDLIKYGLQCDVWFHVDGLSSAHVYLRLPEGLDMEEIPADVLEDCAQLVKQNSIQGLI